MKGRNGKTSEEWEVCRNRRECLHQNHKTSLWGDLRKADRSCLNQPRREYLQRNQKEDMHQKHNKRLHQYRKAQGELRRTSRYLTKQQQENQSQHRSCRQRLKKHLRRRERMSYKYREQLHQHKCREHLHRDHLQRNPREPRRHKGR